MNGGGGGVSGGVSGGAAARVSIPNTARKLIQEVTKTLRSKHSDEFVYATLRDTGMDPAEAGRRLNMIHDIREIAGNHSVEDVYTMLKECNLDANEAAQRLLYLDTFHVVKKKHDRRKITSSDAYHENKQARGYPWRGDKGGRGTFYMPKVSEGAGGGRGLNSGNGHGATNRLERVLRPTLQAQLGKENNGVHTSSSRPNVNGTSATSNGSQIHRLSDASPSISDHVAVSSQNTKHTCAVGTIKCEIVSRNSSNKSNARIPAGTKFSADQLGTSSVPAIADATDPVPVIAEATDSVSVIAKATDSDPIPNVAKENQIPESVQPLLSTQNNSHTVTAFEHTDLTPKEESLKAVVMMEKLTLPSRQAVIFPDHIQVPENYKCQFVFGSLNAASDDCKLVITTESTQQNEFVKEREPSLSNGNGSITAHKGEVQDHVSEDALSSKDSTSPDSSALNHEQIVDIVSPAPTTGFQNPQVLSYGFAPPLMGPHYVSEDALSSKDSTSPDSSALNHEQKVDNVPPSPTTGFQNPQVLSYGFAPPLMGPHYVQLDIPEIQSGNGNGNGNGQVVSAAGQPSVTSPALAGQTSVALSPPLFPYFRPYPNYIPYNPYFPHMYLPQHAHMLNHGVFPPPPPPPTANVHHMQPAAAAGVKPPTPPPNQKESNGNITTSEATDHNTSSTVQQSEDPQAWTRPPVHDIPNILPHYFYNFPQPQHMAAFSPLHAAALYHSSQAMTAQPAVQPPLVYQPQATNGSVEPALQPPASHRSLQHGLEANLNGTALLNTGPG